MAGGAPAALRARRTNMPPQSGTSSGRRWCCMRLAGPGRSTPTTPSARGRRGAAQRSAACAANAAAARTAWTSPSLAGGGSRSRRAPRARRNPIAEGDDDDAGVRTEASLRRAIAGGAADAGPVIADLLHVGACAWRMISRRGSGSSSTATRPTPTTPRRAAAPRSATRPPTTTSTATTRHRWRRATPAPTSAACAPPCRDTLGAAGARARVDAPHPHGGLRPARRPGGADEHLAADARPRARSSPSPRVATTRPPRSPDRARRRRRRRQPSSRSGRRRPLPARPRDGKGRR